MRRYCLASILALTVAQPLLGAIGIDATVSKDQNSASTTVTTPAFSTTASNELLLAFISADSVSSPNTTVTRVASAGLTWVLVKRTNVQLGTAEIWRAFAASPLSAVTVTATLSQRVVSSITVMSFSGVDTSGTNGSGAIGAFAGGNANPGPPAANLVTTRNGSLVLGVGNDWDRAIARTLGTGQGLVHQFLASIGDTYWVQMQSNPIPLSGTNVSINDTAPAGDQYNLSIVEVLPILGSGSGSPNSIVATSGGGQSATVGTAFAAPLVATVRDSGSNPVSGAAVSFAAPNSGASGTFAGGVNTATTNSSGVATSAVFTANSTAGGPYNVTAMVGGVATAANFALSNTAVSNSGIQLRQKNVNGIESSGSSMSVSFLTNNTAGDFLIVTGTAARPATNITVSDTAGNTFFTAFGPVTDANQNVTAYIWYVPNCIGGPNTVTITPATASALEIHVSEWSGLATDSPVDQISSAVGTGTAVSSGAQMTMNDGELVFGYGWVQNTAAVGAGFAGLSFVNGDLDEYLVQPLAGSATATFTQSNGTWFATMVTFKPANGVPSGHSISGTISPASAGSGATLALTGRSTASTTADASGNFSISGLADGSYTVTPSKNGFAFLPTNQLVPVSGSDVSGVNFTAQQVATSGPLSIDVNVSKDQGAPSSTVSTSAFNTVSGNELLLAFVGTDYLSGANTTVTGVSGGGLPWQLVVRTNAQSGTSEIWRAFAPSSLSAATVTATLSQRVASSLTVLSFTGADPSGTNGSGAIGATKSASAGSGPPSGTLVTTRNRSWVFGIGNDYDNAVLRTPGAGQTMVHQNLAPVGDTYWVQREASTTPLSGTTVTINDTAPTTDRYNLAIVEVLPSSTSGGGNPTPPSVTMSGPAPNATVASKTTVAASATSQDFPITGVQFLLDGNNLGALVTNPPYSLVWDTTVTTSGAHTLSAIAYNSANLNATSSPISITVDNSGNPAVVGSWSTVSSLPTVAVNLVLLKNNTVLFYQDGTSPTIWDYLNNKFTSVPAPADLFCSGHAALADGRILVVGGYGGGGNNMGIPNAEIFDPSTNSWTVVPKMAYSRWYPTATTLSDGRILVTGGWQTGEHTNAGIPEIYNPISNTWTQLSNSNNPFETYPFIYQIPDGRLVHVNGSEYATVTDTLDLTTQSWSVVDSIITDGGSASMFLPGKIMKAGSAADSQNVGNSSNTTYVLDMTQATPSWQQTPSMVYPRSFLNLTTLPDGTVLATGGETDKNGGDISKAVYAAELWNPQTQTWTTMASMHTPREYHSTALLLPDGRVLQSGMGADFGNVPDERSAEFYSPPYLFKGTRPTISQAPAQVSYAQNFFVGTPDAATVASAVLIRTGAVTHFFDENTRFVPVSFQQTAGGLTLTAPANANLAPPGYYMLFLVNNNGVPSVAPFVQLAQ